MPGVESQNHRLYIGSHDGVCALNSSDGGKTWEASERTPLSHAASRLTGADFGAATGPLEVGVLFY